MSVETVSSFRTNQRTVRELREELEALNEVLESLQQTVATTATDFTSLQLPLRPCGRACKDFKGVIDKVYRALYWIWDEFQGLGEVEVHGGRYYCV